MRKTPAGLDAVEYGRLEAIIDEWLSDDLAGCLNYLKDNGGLSFISDEVLRRTVSQMAAKNFGKLLTVIKEIESGFFRDKAMVYSFAAEGAARPDLALEYLGQVPVHLADDVYDSFARSWVGAKGGEAVSELLKRKNGPNRLLTTAAMELAGKDFAMAVNVLMAAEPSTMRDGLLYRVFKKATLSPLEKIRFLSLLPEGASGDAITYDAAGMAICQSPAELQRILAAIPNPQIVSNIVKRMTQQLSAARDPDLILGIVESLPSTRLRTEMAKNAAGAYAIKNPTAAIEWATRLTDPIAQTTAVRRAFEIWLLVSPQAAAEHAVAALTDAPDTVFSQLVPSVLVRLTENPSLGSADSVDLTSLRKLSPSSKDILRQKLRGHFSEATWVKFEQLLN